MVEEHVFSLKDEGETVTTQDWDGNRLVERRTADETGAVVAWEVWTHGPGGLVLAHERRDDDGVAFLVTYFAYDDRRLTAARSGPPGNPTNLATLTYDDDGRPIRRETRNDGGPYQIVDWTYLAPAPSLDGVEEVDDGADGIVDLVITRRHDLDGRVVEAETVGAGVETLETWSHDRAGRPVVYERRTDLQLTIERFAYVHGGLSSSAVTEVDDGADSTVDARDAERWVWSCPSTRTPVLGREGPVTVAP